MEKIQNERKKHIQLYTYNVSRNWLKSNTVQEWKAKIV